MAIYRSRFGVGIHRRYYVLFEAENLKEAKFNAKEIIKGKHPSAKIDPPEPLKLPFFSGPGFQI